MSKITTRTLAWQAMMRLEQFTIAQITEESGGSRAFINRYIKALEEHKYLRQHPRVGREKLYQLIKTNGVQAPILDESGKILDPNVGRSPDRYYRYWQAMRLLKTFSVQEIWFCADAEMEQTKPQVFTRQAVYPLYGYLSALKRAGYLTGGGKNKKYQLVRDTGVLPPLFEAPKKHVFDFNDRSVYPLTGTTI